ncbi:hypothetical protein HSX11_19655 [Oxalobacteraceae bacterium]|nr:hypothetical protein [Oxalobacteraceae bacterium]
MLTATYTLVALSVEQASMRMSLLSFQHYVRSSLVQQHSLSLDQLEYACETLHRLYESCHWRKIEIYLIPAIRQATERADKLLDELSRLNQSALGAIRTMQERIGRAQDGADEQVEQICASIETFCNAMLQRLEKEERELFSIARSAICGDAWFAIANQFMTHDAELVEARKARPSRPALVQVAGKGSAAALAACATKAARAAAAPASGGQVREDGAASDMNIARFAVLPAPGIDAEAGEAGAPRWQPARRAKAGA